MNAASELSQHTLRHDSSSSSATNDSRRVFHPTGRVYRRSATMTRDLACRVNTWSRNHLAFASPLAPGLPSWIPKFNPSDDVPSHYDKRRIQP